MLTLEQILSKTKDLPSLPQATLKVMKETESPQGSAKSVAHCMAQDQALSAKVLRLANSAYYGLPRQVTDLSEAVVLLGMRTVKNLAVVASTYPWMVRPLIGYALGPNELFRHSMGVAIAGQLIAKQTRKVSEDLAFTAGLLHNLGKVAMSIWLEDRLSLLLERANREGISFDEAERSVLGYDHTEVGSHLAEQWNLPEALVLTIRYHHRPDALEQRDPLVDTIHVADFLATSMGCGIGGDGLHYLVSEDALESLGISDSKLEFLACEFTETYAEQMRIYEELAK